MTSIAIVYNNFCVKCGRVEKKMVRIGAIVMCEECFETEFKTDDPIAMEREVYLQWLKKSNGESV